MKRQVMIEDIQKLYTSNDMAKTDCGGCKGCSDCCSGMGESVILDPYDLFCLEKGLEKTFGELLQMALELNVVDGVILPNLRMKGEEERCVFLNEEGRCGIHGFRPGICRLFPLGRYYEEGTFHYFLQSRECPKEPKTKIRISKWLGIGKIRQYEDYITRWHYLTEEIADLIEKTGDEQLAKDLNSYLLETFYVTPYKTEEEFETQFEPRYHRMKKLLQILAQQDETGK